MDSEYCTVLQSCRFSALVCWLKVTVARCFLPLGAWKLIEMNKKEKIREYKDSPRPMGVFQIRNKINGRIFIGSSCNLPAIFNRFRTELKFGSCRNVVLQEDWNLFGSEAFEFEELEILKPLDDPQYNSSEDLRLLTELWLEKLRPFGDRGYNKPLETGV